MDLITKNPGLQHIIEETFMNLDHENLLKCQQVNLSWKIILKNPTFWLKKCVQKGLSKEDQLEWYKLIQNLKIKRIYLENVKSHLMELHESLDWHVQNYHVSTAIWCTATTNQLCVICGRQKLHFSVSTFLKTLSNTLPIPLEFLPHTSHSVQK